MVKVTTLVFAVHDGIDGGLARGQAIVRTEDAASSDVLQQGEEYDLGTDSEFTHCPAYSVTSTV